MFENINWCAWLPWFLLGAAILGGLIGYYWRKWRMGNQWDNLQTRSNEYDKLQVTYASLQDAKLEADNQNIQLQAEIAELKAALEKEQAQLKVCNMTVEGHDATIAKLEAENKRLGGEMLLLQQELEDVSKSAATRDVKDDIPMAASAPMLDSEAILAEIKANSDKIPTTSLGVALENKRDNLLKINHITPWQEAKLNAAGISRYLQIARMQDEEAAIIAEVAQLDAETIKNDDWKGQARALLAAIAAAAPKDNLKKVEGIGPKIEQLCFDNGIYTFHDLSRTPVSVLKHILKEGGSRFRMHNPGTWPKQAELAAKGEWEELKKWQDILDGGV